MQLSLLGLGLMIVAGLFAVGMFTLTTASYVGFACSIMIIWQYRKKLGLEADGEGAKMPLIVGSVALLFGLVGNSRFLSIPGVIMLIAGGSSLLMARNKIFKEKLVDAKKQGRQEAEADAAAAADGYRPQTKEHNT